MHGRVDPYFWKDKKVFITGHTGFKGSWLCLWLQAMGAQVKGAALPPDTRPSLFECASVSEGMESENIDIRDRFAIAKSIRAFSPEILIHMAAQPLVQRSYLDPVLTYETNIMGTLHVLEACRGLPSLRAIVNVTTDKCYENKEWVWGYREDEPMGGFDPYSNSKGCVELITSSYRRSFFPDTPTNQTALASARAGNVIGGGDWSQDRLIPDLLTAFQNSEAVVIRNPDATRPWQHVLEPLSGYLVLAQYLHAHGHKYAEGWNFGPRDEDARPVRWIVEKMSEQWGDDASWTLDSESRPHEARYLKLDISKASSRLKWQPTWSLDETLERIVKWHKKWLSGENIRHHTLNEIDDFLKSDIVKQQAGAH